MYQAALDQLAYRHWRESTSDLLPRKRPKFDSAQQFGAFCRLIYDHEPERAGMTSPTAVYIDALKLGCVVQTSRVFEESLIRYHDNLVREVLITAKRWVGELAYRAWVSADVERQTVRQVAGTCDVGRDTAQQLIRAGRDAVEDILAANRMLRQ
jgi:hypothetical protein